jgi:putative hydrolase of the HAD superfamily
VIEGVLLDVGGVFTTPDHGMLRSAIGPAGGAVDPEVLDRSHYAGMAALDAGFRSAGTLDWRQYDAAVARAAGVAEDSIEEAVERLERGWTSIRAWRRMVPGAIDGLRQLARTGVSLGLVSNSDGTVAEQMVAAKVCQVGEGEGVPVVIVIDSAVVGIEKPDPRIFALALDALGTPPDRTVHVGDAFFADVAGARAAGVRPLHLDPYRDCVWPPEDHEHVRSLADVAALVRRESRTG